MHIGAVFDQYFPRTKTYSKYLLLQRHPCSYVKAVSSMVDHSAKGKFTDRFNISEMSLSS